MTIAVAATAEPDHNPPRVRIDVTSTGSTPNPVGASSSVAFYRIDADGVKRKVITESGLHLSGGGWTAFDYHAPFNVASGFTATAAGFTATAATATLTSASAWLLHPNNPALSLEVAHVKGFADLVTPSTAALAYPFGAQYPTSITEGTRRARSGTLTVTVESEGQLAGLNSLLRDGGPVLMNLAGPDAGEGWWDETWAWIQPGDTSVANPFKHSEGTFREVTIPYQVIDTPSGLAVPTWLWSDIIANFATWQDVIDAYETWGDVITNTTASTPGGALLPDVEPGMYISSSLTEDPAHPGLYLLST